MLEPALPWLLGVLDAPPLVFLFFGELASSSSGSDSSPEAAAASSVSGCQSSSLPFGSRTFFLADVLLLLGGVTGVWRSKRGEAAGELLGMGIVQQSTHHFASPGDVVVEERDEGVLSLSSCSSVSELSLDSSTPRERKEERAASRGN